jgi:hypothetical protein
MTRAHEQSIAPHVGGNEAALTKEKKRREGEADQK